MHTPESQGISSAAIGRFLDRMEKHPVHLHGMQIIRRGHTIAEGYWAPYNGRTPHRLYSVSKSFTAAAVGLLLDEGRICLTDAVAPFFTDAYEGALHPYLARTTVRDLLMMASPHASTTYGPRDPQWVRTFFERRPTHPPGALFSYNTAATVVLSALVERISGQTLMEYLHARLLRHMGFAQPLPCIETPEGVCWGGSGMLCTLREMSAFALLLMQGGRWAGRPLLSEAFVRAATARQIDNAPDGGAGYGYQIWRIPENGFQLNGMGSQYVFCFPDKALLFACFADTQLEGERAAQALMDGVYADIWGQAGDGALEADPPAQAALSRRLASLRMQPVRGALSSDWMEAVQGKAYRLEPGPMGITQCMLRFEADGGVFAYEKHGKQMEIAFGLGALRGGVFPEAYDGMRIGEKAARGYRYYASAAWVEPHKLTIRVHVLDRYLGGLRILLSFQGNAIAVQMEKAAEWFLTDYQGFTAGTAL